MPIDTSIYGNIRPVETPDLMGAVQKGMALSQLGMQNQQLQQQFQQQQALRQAYAQNTDQNGNVNKQGVLSTLGKMGLGQMVPETGATFAKQDKEVSEAKTSQMGALHQQASVVVPHYGYLLSLSDDKAAQIYPEMKQQLQNQGVDTTNLPDSWDRSKIKRGFDVASQYKETIDNRKTMSDVGINETKAPGDRAKTQAEIRHLDAETAQLGGGKPLVAEQADKLAGHEASLHMINDLRSTIAANKDDFGPIVGRIASSNPYNSRGQEVSALFKKASQTIGKSLEGGKLTDADYAKYQKMLPNQNDTPEVANAKLDQLERMVASQRNADLDTYRRVGSNVKNFDLTQAPDISVARPKAGSARSIGLGVREANAGQTIRMVAPDGSIRLVPISQKGEAIAAGGKVAQ